MLGAIIGDIIGSPYEFDQSAPKAGFTLFAEECSYTDDTICTVAIADAILRMRPYQESLLDWCHRYPNPMNGYGNMYQTWLQEKNPLPQSSFGNGAAMRVSPIGWLFDDFHDVLRESKRCTEVSHCHSEGIRGAQCIATLVYWLRTCRITKDEIESAVKSKFGYDIPPLKDIYRIGSQGHFDSTCQETVPWAIRCFLESESFEDAIRIAVGAGGDTDTKAAICGSIAEAYYEVPEELIEQAYEYLPSDMLRVIDRFYEHVGRSINS